MTYRMKFDEDRAYHFLISNGEVYTLRYDSESETDLKVVILVNGKNTGLRGYRTFLGFAEAPIDLKPEWVTKSGFSHATDWWFHASGTLPYQVFHIKLK
jgi:hypothetical protein